VARKLLLIDANSLIHRAYHALPHLTTRDGRPTNAVFGLAQMLLGLFEEQRPDEVAMVFDAPGPTFRDEMYSGYKASRPKMDAELVSQLPIIRQMVDAMGIVALEQPGYEADDIIGTLAPRARREGYETVIVSGDRDLLQLLDEGVRVLITTRGTKEVVDFDTARFEDEYGLTPTQLVDLKGLSGDSSDDIPGIAGIGDKTAKALLQAHGTIEDVYEHIDEVSPAVGRKLCGKEDEALLWKTLAQIRRDVPIGEAADDLTWRGFNSTELRKLLATLEFSKLLDRVPAASEGDAEGSVGEADARSLDALCASARHTGRLYAVPSEHGGVTALGLATGPGHAISYILPAVGGTEPQQGGLFTEPDDNATMPAALTAVFADPDIAISGCRLKQLDHALAERGVEVANLAFDAEIASYLLASHRSDHGIELGMAQYLGWELPDASAEECDGLAGWRARGATEALAAAHLEKRFLRDLEAAGMRGLFEDVEMPLVGLLARMERAGIGLDAERLAEVGEELSEKLTELSAEIFAVAGEEFNIASPKQVGDVLFERLKLPKGRKTKTGWSTAAGILEDLAEEHEIAALILQHREYSKLVSTYVDALVREVDDATGLVHTSFEQTVTATGRLASRGPNLQNIPTRTELGRRIRSCFWSGVEGHVLVCADYSQIELRILAHMSDEPTLMEAFRADEDIHTHTATLIFDCSQDEVDYAKRRVAKTVNYAVLYGMGPRALAADLGISNAEANDFIDNYQKRLPEVGKFMDATVEQARQHGYVSTLMGRRRYLPDLGASHPGLRAYAERAAANTPLQGSAADIVKVAMLRLEQALCEGFDDVQMLLQVHDEIVLRAPAGRVATFAPVLREVMEGAYELSVPLTVDISVGDNWRDVELLSE
jgi:DNA polymerase I